MRSPGPVSARLWIERTAAGSRIWTVAVGGLPPVYGERWIDRGGRWFRAWNPAHSKLSAAIDRGWEGPVPQEGERWLYLGAATGTTVSHVADLAGPSGVVYAVEKSVRPFQRLLALAGRWPNVRPLLTDARSLPVEPYFLPIVDGLYADLPQPDQVEIVLHVAQRFLNDGGALLMALKTSSMGRERSAPMHLEEALRTLDGAFDLERPVRLAPWYRGHYFLGGEARARFAQGAPAVRPPPDYSPEAGPPSRRPRRGGHGPGRRSGRGSER